jgi:hypothetical protein
MVSLSSSSHRFAPPWYGRDREPPQPESRIQNTGKARFNERRILDRIAGCKPRINPTYAVAQQQCTILGSLVVE